MEEVYISDKIKVYKTIEENVTRLAIVIDDSVYIYDIVNELTTNEPMGNIVKYITKASIKSALETHYNVDEIVEKIMESL